MAENLIVNTSLSRAAQYELLLPQLQALVEGETDLIANLGNIAAALKSTFDFLWIGFYLKKGDNLVLGPFQGPIACTRIAFDKGVCGACYTQAKTLVVPDVHQFPGHIACSSASNSEIVVPVFDSNGDVSMVFDLDSVNFNDFSDVDAHYLEKIVQLIKP